MTSTMLALRHENGAESVLRLMTEERAPDAVGFLPPPGRPPMFGDPAQLARLDAWVDLLVRGALG